MKTTKILLKTASTLTLALAATSFLATPALAGPVTIEEGTGSGSLLNGSNTADGEGTVALGLNQNATGNGAVAIGNANTATESAVALGDSNVANGWASVAMGYGNETQGRASVAMGAFAYAAGDGAVTLGWLSSASGDSAVALGEGATAAGNFNIAIGNSSWAIGASSVALGNNSVATEANTVSVGSTTQQRRIVNVADGTQATDAVNLRQLSAVNALVNTALSQNVTQDNRLTAIEAMNSAQNGRLTTLETSLGTLGANVELYNRQASGGIAAAMAMGGTIIPADASGAISFNLATYRGQQGFSGVLVQRIAPKVYFNLGVAGSTVKGSTGGRMGVTIGW